MAICREVPVRVRILVLIFVTRFLVECIASNFSLCITYMVQSHKEAFIPWCIRKNKNNNSTIRKWRSLGPNYGPRYKWTKQQELLFSEFFILGQIISSVPAGILAENFGPFYITLFATFVGAILNISRTFVVALNWKAVLVLEFFIGFDVGLVLPPLMVWVARWAPPNERGIFVYASTGKAFGMAIMELTAKFGTPVFGWPGLFYGISSIVILFCVGLFFLGSNHPEDHRSITQRELRYIKRSQRGNVTYTKSIPPYGKILNSKHFWALCILNVGFNWGLALQFRSTPRYLHEFIGFSYQEVAYLGLLLYSGILTTAVISAVIGDFIRTKNMFSDTTVVKMYIFFSHVLPGGFLLFMPMAYCNANIVYILLFSGISFIGFATISVRRTAIDLAPNYAGTIYGMLVALRRIIDIIILRLENVILKLDHGIIGWTIVFLIGGGCLFGTAVIFLFFGSGACQWWNQKPQDIRFMLQKFSNKPDKGTASATNRQYQDRPGKETTDRKGDKDETPSTTNDQEYKNKSREPRPSQDTKTSLTPNLQNQDQSQQTLKKSNIGFKRRVNFFNGKSKETMTPDETKE